MKKNIFLNHEIVKTLKSRLNSQRRFFNFDNNYVLVLPFLEHKTTDAALNSIKFYINNNSDYVNISEIEYLNIDNNKAILQLNNGDSANLHYRRMDGVLTETQIENFSMKKLSIDHVPSIYVVLYSHYLRKTKTFNVLSNFCNKLSIAKWDTTVIKESGFKKNVEKTLNHSPDKDEILNAYECIFNDINLEITISENNNANSSVESLEYFKQNN